MSRAEVARHLAEARAAGLSVAFANGAFDLLHVGHLRYLEAAKREADLLVVGVNDDASVARLKGPDRPLVPAAERAELVAMLAGDDDALAAVAAVIANVLLRALAVAVFDIPQPEFEELNLRPVILSTLGGVIAAGLVYALIARFTPDPSRPFVIVAAVALALSLIAPLTIDDPNADADAVGTLIAMHVVAAAISVPVMLKARPAGGR